MPPPGPVSSILHILTILPKITKKSKAKPEAAPWFQFCVVQSRGKDFSLDRNSKALVENQLTMNVTVLFCDS